MTTKDEDLNETPQQEPAAEVADEASAEPFDPAAAVAELEAAMAASEAARPEGSGAADRYIAVLEDEVLQLGALMEAREAEVKQATDRAERAHQQIAQAGARLKKEAATKLQRQTRKVLLAFVDVLDDLDRALESARQMDHNPEVVAGVELVRRSFIGTLAGFNVASQPAMGARFDPALHNAVSTLPVDDPQQDGHVVAVVIEGYLINDSELLRPASVVVGKAG